MKVSNRKCVRHLAWKSLLASRTRNLIAIVAIALTTMLFTSLFTIALSINEGFQQSNFRQVGGFSHGGFKYMTQAQFNELKDDPLISQWGERRYLGMPTEEPFNKSHVEVSFADANEAHWMFCDPVEGSLPQEGTDQAATDTHVLELLGIKPEIGAEFTLTFDVDGHETTQTFTLCGWWEYDEAIVANHVLIPESRVNEVLAEVGVNPDNPDDGMTGRWNLDVMLKSGSRHIERDLNQILENYGYQSENAGDNYIDTGVNWGYTGARMSDLVDPMTVIAIAGVILLIVFTGYLIIYNVFQISVAGDILRPAENHRHHAAPTAAHHPAASLGPLCRWHPYRACPWLAHRRAADPGDCGPAQWDYADDLCQSLDLCHLCCLRTVDGAYFLPEAGTNGGQGFPGGGSALHRRQQRKGPCQGPKGPKGQSLHDGLGQPGPQQRENRGDGALSVSGGGTAHCNGEFRRRL